MAYLDKLLSAGEKILVQRRLHWAVFVSTAVSLAIQGVFFFALYKGACYLRDPIAAPGWFPHDPEFRRALAQVPTGVFDRLALGIALLFAFIAVTTILKTVLIWMSRYTVITDVRVLQVQGILSKTVVDSSLEKINDVHLNQSMLGRLLGYGTLVIMTASETGLNSMYFLKDPVDFKRIMMDAKRKLSDGGGTIAPAPAAPKQQAADRLAELEDLRKRGLINAAEFEAKRRKVLEEI
ncbi:MAG TPA: PH domain-containing protein [Kiritimatiellia bacterium]